MNTYSLYTFDYCPVEAVQTKLFVPQNVKVDMSTNDKNLWLDRLFGERNTDVRIQRMKKRGGGADKFPCKVLNHGGRVVWLRLENEKVRRMWVKHRSGTPNDPDPISKEDIAENPFSYIFLDFREGRKLIAIMKANDAWRNTDVEATLLEESLNILMQDKEYGFGIKLVPETVPKDYWDYNRQLILKDKRRVRKLTIYFGEGTLDSRVTELINQSPLLKRLQKEMFKAKRGKFELEDPSGASIFDKRKKDIRNIIELIVSNLTSDAFGLTLSYADGLPDLVCGKDVRLMFTMKDDMLDMLFSQNLFGEYKIYEWLDAAIDYIKKEKDETPAESKGKKKAPGHAKDTSTTLDLF